MRLSDKTRKTINAVILSITLMMWILLLTNPGNILSVQHCPVTAAGPSRASLEMLLAMNPIPGLLAGWTLMVIAMMLPKLIIPIRYIYSRSLKRRRFYSAMLFVIGYVLVWVGVGFLMIAAILGLNLLFPKSYIPAIGAGALALVWQFSPIKQRCLNRGHNHWNLAAFGWAATRDAFFFGLAHGLWCVGSGWALMLFPMLLPGGHNMAMMLVTLIMLSEHLEHPRLPRWRIYFTGKLLLMLFAQTQIKLRRAFDLN